MDHSLRGYLDRRSTAEPEGILCYLRERREEYEEELEMVLDILAERKRQTEFHSAL